ncbi:MAG: hypothetical protein WBA13_01235 [Microcoleaceae cyanobacterium]
MLSEIGSELLVTGFVTLIHRLWDFLHREEIDSSLFPLELAEMSEPEYQHFVERFASHGEEN